MLDVILFWNDVALEANRISNTNDPREQPGPVLAARALAIVHLAMYDAYAAFVPSALHPSLVGGPYLPPPPPPAGPSGPAAARAAAAGAAHFALSRLYPSQAASFSAKFAEFGGADNPATQFGRTVAGAILKDREDDPLDNILVNDILGSGYGPSLARGKHRVDPDNPTQGFYAPFYGSRARGFAITHRHCLDAPPLDDSEYRDALREVRGVGIAPELMGTLLGTPLPSGFAPRTAAETLVGIYWGYDGSVGVGTPPRLYNQIVRQLAIARNTPEADNARLFALVNAAMADAGTLAWEQKYCYDFWRPVVGIREHDRSLGPAAPTPANPLQDGTDPGWLPLGAPASNAVNPTVPGRKAMTPKMPVVCPTDGPDRFPRNFTPNFPAYPSGHATFGAAALHITRLFYGVSPGTANWGPDTVLSGLNFDFVSNEFNGATQDVRGTVRPRHRRTFAGGLWDMILENGRSRVFLGVHWIFDAFAAVSDTNRDPDFTKNIGGVPLGLKIAEDIFANGLKRSTTGPLVNCECDPAAPAPAPEPGEKPKSRGPRRKPGG